MSTTDHIRLSVIVPVYNEAPTIDVVLDRLASAPYLFPEQQVIVVDDGSTDGTSGRLAAWEGTPGLTLLRHPVNRGKGAAVRTGLARAEGRVVVVQDADLEYEPTELRELVRSIERGECDAAFGSRYLTPTPGLPWTRFRIGVGVMNRLVRLLYGVRLTDVNTCYKVLPNELYRRLDLRSDRFELCAEVTAKLCRLGCRIAEVPISYRPRTRAEGKKIGWRDALQFARSLIAWRVAPVSALGRPLPRTGGAAVGVDCRLTPIG